MATIDYKEKYEQALERARQFSEKPYLEDSAGIVEYIFPELKESEDERIKDRLINYFHGFLDGHEDTYKVGGCVKWEGLDVKDVITWLEKQGDENIVVVIPKFRVGDVIRPKDSAAEYTIESISGECYHGKGWGLPISCDNDYELVEQKPAEWNEEDESHIRYLIECLENCKKGVALMMTTSTAQEYINWLKSLKDRVLPQSKQEWSEEDEKQLQHTIAAIQWYAGDADIIAWIKSLKYRVQPNPALGEEDRRMLIGLIDELDAIMNKATPNEISVYSKYTNWLKSLKPQSTWKPSDEQMEALRVAYEVGTANESWAMDKLKGLYQELKKLME